MAETAALATRPAGAAQVAQRVSRATAPPRAQGATGATRAAPPPEPRSWLNFRKDRGGSAPITGQLGPYPTRVGKFLDKIGIRQGYQSRIINHDRNGSWFARMDTAVHEGFHKLVARYLPSFRNLSHTNRIWGAAARYPEEVLAYAAGHAGALRPHAVPLAPLEAFSSLGGYTMAQQIFAKVFWGAAWAGAGAVTIDHYFNE